LSLGKIMTNMNKNGGDSQNGSWFSFYKFFWA
jgi:hypothetical protein